ncbi:hypothetical protein MUP32_06465, partial [Candidatus Microgenomates bacterium]|nr:hypothetical protein [Candidatus Microgenomates bacterium]
MKSSYISCIKCIYMLLELDRPTHIPHSLIPFAVLPPYAPPGDYDRSTLLFVPDCYREATETFNRLQAAGFHLNEAGISVPTHPIDVAETVALLSLSLESNMVTTIPHHLLRLIPTKDGGKYFPAICTRTLLGVGVDHSKNRLGSIIDEFGFPVTISFRDESPYCIFPEHPEKDIPKPSKIILKEIKKRLGDRYAKMHEQEIAILAGIGRATPEVVEKANLQIPKIAADIHRSAKVMNLAQL